MSKARTIALAFGIVIIIVLASFYFILVQGVCDHILLKEINKKTPFVLKWKARTFLSFCDLAITEDNGYFFAPGLKINLTPFVLEFQEGYASQGKKIIAKDISARIPIKFVWPYKFYPCGRGYIQSGQLNFNKVTLLRPKLDLMIDQKTILIKELEGKFLESPVWAKGKIDLGKKYFTLSGLFDRIDMEALTAIINSKKFGSSGKWRGSFDLRYQEESGLRGEGGFELLSQRGDLKTIFLKDLIQKMPEGDARDRLLQGLGEDEYFSLYKGGMDFYIKGEDIKIKLILEGEKGLLDFTINLPASLVERFFGMYTQVFKN